MRSSGCDVGQFEYKTVLLRATQFTKVMTLYALK